MLYELTTVPIHQTATTNCISPVQQKDYSRPLHVDCSVEYELPSQVKPPPSTNGKIDPLLMIHPCYFRKIEAQRRSPFINNLPGRGVSTAVSSNTTSSSTVNISNQIVSNQCTANRIISGQTNSTSTNPQQQQHTTGSVSHSRSVKTQQQQSYQQATIPHYHMPNNVRHQQHGWPTDHQHQHQPANSHLYTKQATTLSAAVGTVTKHPSHHHHHHQLPSCAGVTASNDLYNTSATLEGGLWTNTNHSPLAAERFPEPQVTLHQIQPTITATDNNTITAATTTSCSKILATGKYRQYLRTHRLHPYMSMASTAFPQFTQMQQISCYNV